MLIVEGFDNTGKSTLAEALKAKYGFSEIVKSPGAVPYRKLFLFADKYISGMEKIRLSEKPITTYPVLHDRFPVFSDQVYGSILRGINPFIELNEGEWLTTRLGRVSPTVIYCRPPTNVIIKFEDEREQMEGVEDNALVLLGKYDEMMMHWGRRTGNPIIAYNYTIKSSFEALEEQLAKRGWEPVNG